MAIKTLRGASALALLFGTSGFAAAVAQQAPAAPNQTVNTSTQAGQQATTSGKVDTTAPAETAAADKVVITGSLIATTAEDAPKPVEVYTLDDLQAAGAPNTSEFIRSLSVTTGDDLGFGQATAEVPTGSGFTNANMRGLGSSATLVLMNGRRTAAANGGFGADINMVPMEALTAVEVLKDGASATYGAGAVGGVINFKTRRDVNGPQISVSQRFYDAGTEYEGSFLDGWVSDVGNVLISLQYEHEDPALQSKFPWAKKTFDENPSIYRLLPMNPGRFHTSTNFLTGAPVSSGVPNASAVAVGATSVSDVRSSTDCETLGGIIVNKEQQGNTTALDGCGFNTSDFTDGIQEHTGYRVYSEFNAKLTDNMEVHFDVSYGKNENFFRQLPFSPIGGVPTSRSTDASVSAFCTSSCFYVTPVQVNTYNAAGQVNTAVAATRNPFIDDFMARTGVTSATLPDTGALYESIFWSPALFGGIPLTESGLRRERYHREQLILNGGMNGEFTAGTLMGFLAGVHYDWNAQYSQYKQENQQPDVSVARLQSALLGYGGPNCNAVDVVPTDYTSAASFNRTVGVQSNTAPGTNGCQWFNPFSSSFSTSIVNGASNPNFNSGNPLLGGNATARPTGYQNPKDLWDWLWIDRNMEDIYESGTFEGTISGRLPDKIALPGGRIGWALGSQWRMIERRSFAANDKLPNEEAMLTQECPYPDPAVVNVPAQSNQDVGQRGCATATGAFYSLGRANITTRNVPAYSDSQNIALFGQLDIPVLDNLNFSYNFRHEEFNGGDLKGDIWSLAGKYNLTDNIYFRASYGTNYRAEAALDLDPGTVTFGSSTQSRFANQVLQTTNRISSGIGPEDDATTNIGIGYDNRDIFGGRLHASVDFFELAINGAIASTSITTILTDIFGANTATAQANRGVSGVPNTALINTSGQFANCGANLIGFVQFTSPCVTGTTTAAQILNVDLFQLNGPDFITNGLDWAFDYSHDLFDGVASFSLQATQTMHYKQGAFNVNGTVFSTGGNRLGFTNLSDTGIAAASQKWKGNATLRWANDVHSISLRANYGSGSLDERYALGQLTPIQTTPTTQYSLYGVEPDKQITYDATYTFNAPFMKDLQLRASVINIANEDPSPLQVRSGYYNGSADPRGRILELGLQKKF